MCQPPPPPLLRGPAPPTYFHPFFFNFSDSPCLGEVIKIYFPLFKKGGVWAMTILVKNCVFGIDSMLNLKSKITVANNDWLGSLPKVSLFHRCFKHSASKNQLPGFNISGTLVENGLTWQNRMMDPVSWNITGGISQ